MRRCAAKWNLAPATEWALCAVGFVFAGCGLAGSGPKAEPAAKLTEPPTAEMAKPREAPPVGRTNPRIGHALQQIDEAKLRADVAALAVPRHAVTSPAGLSRAARYIEEALSHLGFTARRETVHWRGASADNIVAQRAGVEGAEGTRPVVVVAAHYDAVATSPGADDNASGVAGALGVARAVAAVRTNADVRVVAFAFEEEGLIGSREHVGALGAEGRARIQGVFNLEMIGYRDLRPNSQRFPPGFETLRGSDALPTRGDFIGALALSGMTEPLDALESARVYVPSLVLETAVVPRLLVPVVSDVLRSDHASFWLYGVPAVIVADTAELRNPHYHQPTDTPQTLDYEFATQVTRLVAAATLEMAGVAP